MSVLITDGLFSWVEFSWNGFSLRLAETQWDSLRLFMTLLEFLFWEAPRHPKRFGPTFGGAAALPRLLSRDSPLWRTPKVTPTLFPCREMPKSAFWNPLHTQSSTSILIWFYVKSNFGEFKRSQIVSLDLLRLAETRWDSLSLAETRWVSLRLAETRWDFLWPS